MTISNFFKNALIFATGATTIALGTMNSAQASIKNIGFENGFDNWETIGNTSIQNSQGNNEAFLSSGSTYSDSEIEEFLGLANGALDSLGNGDATVGSAIKQTFTANAGDTVSFQWNFLTNEVTPDIFNDFSFVFLTNLSELADTNSTFALSPTSLNEETGFHTFSTTISEAGTYNLGLGVMNVTDTFVDSGLVIDGTQSVPEPTTILGLLAVGGLGVASRRKKQTAK